MIEPEASYPCSEVTCRDERTYPADELRIGPDGPICSACWLDPIHTAPDAFRDHEGVQLPWYDLDPFVPFRDRQIKQLRDMMQGLLKKRKIPSAPMDEFLAELNRDE